jgi:hypothetical protein
MDSRAGRVSPYPGPPATWVGLPFGCAPEVTSSGPRIPDGTPVSPSEPVKRFDAFFPWSFVRQHLAIARFDRYRIPVENGTAESCGSILNNLFVNFNF